MTDTDPAPTTPDDPDPDDADAAPGSDPERTVAYVDDQGEELADGPTTTKDGGDE